MGAQRCQVTCSRSPSMKGQNRDSNSALRTLALGLALRTGPGPSPECGLPALGDLEHTGHLAMGLWPLSQGCHSAHTPEAPWLRRSCPPRIPSRPSVSQSTRPGACTQAHTQVGPSSQGIPRGARDGKGVGLGESIWVLGQTPPPSDLCQVPDPTLPLPSLYTPGSSTLPRRSVSCPAKRVLVPTLPCPWEPQK